MDKYIEYVHKYRKYKLKYLELNKNKLGGSSTECITKKLTEYLKEATVNREHFEQFLIADPSFYTGVKQFRSMCRTQEAANILVYSREKEKLFISSTGNEFKSTDNSIQDDINSIIIAIQCELAQTMSQYTIRRTSASAAPPSASASAAPVVTSAPAASAAPVVTSAASVSEQPTQSEVGINSDRIDNVITGLVPGDFQPIEITGINFGTISVDIVDGLVATLGETINFDKSSRILTINKKIKIQLSIGREPGIRWRGEPKKFCKKYTFMNEENEPIIEVYIYVDRWSFSLTVKVINLKLLESVKEREVKSAAKR